MTEAAGGGGGGGSVDTLDVNELTQKLATIPVDDTEDGGEPDSRPFISENSSTAAIFGSEGGTDGTKRGWGMCQFILHHSSLMINHYYVHDVGGTSAVGRHCCVTMTANTRHLFHPRKNKI